MQAPATEAPQTPDRDGRRGRGVVRFASRVSR